MLLLAIELYKGGEHAYKLLIVSMSMSKSKQNREKIGSPPGFESGAKRAAQKKPRGAIVPLEDYRAERTTARPETALSIT